MIKNKKTRRRNQIRHQCHDWCHIGKVAPQEVWMDRCRLAFLQSVWLGDRQIWGSGQDPSVSRCPPFLAQSSSHTNRMTRTWDSHTASWLSAWCPFLFGCSQHVLALKTQPTWSPLQCMRQRLHCTQHMRCDCSHHLPLAGGLPDTPWQLERRDVVLLTQAPQLLA